MRAPALAIVLALVATLSPPPARAWGSEGHEIVALIAEHYLQPRVKARVQALLAADTSGLVPDTSIAAEANWADRYRDSDRDTTRMIYERTRRWHFVNLELHAPSLERACFGFPSLPAGIPASLGPARDCAVDKINQFAAELSDLKTSPPERRIALQFLLHLVGDVHQPLHAADDHDDGGNDRRVSMRGFRAGSLHHYWDTVFVRALGPDPHAVAAQLLAQITPAQVQAWGRGAAADWARESFRVARDTAYQGLPKPNARGRYRLSSAYVDAAVSAVGQQLSRAGVRLALLLNASLQ